MNAKKSKKTPEKGASTPEVIDLDRPAPADSRPIMDRASWFGDLFDVLPSAMRTRLLDVPHLLEPAAAMRCEEFVDDDVLVIRAEIPGVDPQEGIEVTVDRGRLTIEAERRAEKEETDTSGYRSEFQYGSLRRTLPLPEGASPDDVDATYEDGILEVRIPIEAGDDHRRVVDVVRR